jgi:hypothetical protein
VGCSPRRVVVYSFFSWPAHAQAKDAAGAQAASAQATAHSTAASAKQHLSAMGEARALTSTTKKSHRTCGDGAKS